MPEPPDEDGPILVQTQAIGICGTDAEIINGEYGSAPPGEDRLIIGHESLGRVVEEAPGTGGGSAMKPRTTKETAMICVAAVLVVTVLIIPFEIVPFGQSANTRGLLWLAVAAVAALGIVLGYRDLTTRKRAPIELTSGEQYRKLAEEYRRLADMAITAQEHTNLKLGDVSAQLDHIREQTESLHKILREVK